MKSPEVLYYTYISERIDPTIDNGTPIVHEDSRQKKKEASSCLYYSKTCIEVKCTHESTVVPAHTTNACRGGLEVHIEVSGQFHAPAVLFHGKET